MTTSSLQNMCRKTRMCRFYLAGLCGRGEECSFAHGADEVRAAPDLHCTKICPALIRSGCCPDKDCAFAHSASQLRQLRAEQQAQAQPAQARGQQARIAAKEAGGRRKPVGAASPMMMMTGEECRPMMAEGGEAWGAFPAGAGEAWGAYPPGAGGMGAPGMQLSLHAALPGSVQKVLMPPQAAASKQPQDMSQQGTLLWVPWVVPPGATEGEVLQEIAKVAPASVETLASCKANDLALSRQSTVDSGPSLGWKSPPAYVGGVRGLSQQSTCESDEFEYSFEPPKVLEQTEMPKLSPSKHMQRNKFHKTRLCAFFEKGSCHKGTRCNFAHGAADLQPLPDLSCTKLCQQLLDFGQCTDPDCTFAHTQEELRAFSREAGFARHVSFSDEGFQARALAETVQPASFAAQRVASTPEDSDDLSSFIDSDDDLDPAVDAAHSGWGRQCTEDPSLSAVRMVRVKNTFLDVEEDEAVEVPKLRRSNSAPSMATFLLDSRASRAKESQKSPQLPASTPRSGLDAMEPAFKDPLPYSFLQPSGRFCQWEPSVLTFA